MSSLVCSPILSRRAARLAGLLALLLTLCLGGARAEAMPVPGTAPSIWSDQADYRPGASVTLGGSGWGPGESVHITVNDDTGSTWSRDVDVTASDNGEISDTFSLPDWFVAEYSVTATGATGAVATTSFTDGNLSFNLATVDQAAPANLSWTVTWDHFSDTTCTTNDGHGTTSYIGNNVQVNNSEPKVGNKQSGTPRGATASGYVLDYWSTSPTSTTHATPAQLCDGTNANVTFYAHFKASQQVTALTVQDAAGAYGGSTNLSATLTSGGSAVSGKTIAFSVKGTSVGTATTNAAGVATKSGVDLTGISAGTYAGGVTATFSPDTNFLASSATGVLSVSPRPVTGSFTAADKTYDANSTATITGRSLAGALSGDDVTLSGGSASFDDKNVGVGKTVSGTGFALGGADARNYSLESSDLATTATITAKPLSGSFTAADKVYDGNRDATITGSSPGAGVVDGDDVSLDGSGATAQFDTKDAGQDKTITGSGFALAGGDSGNYALSMGTASASITPKPIAGAFTAADKVYDGATGATITGRSLSGAVDGDTVSLSGGTAAFASKSAGEDKAVSGSGFALAGADEDDYTLASVTDAHANITPKPITGSFTAADKIYDGTTAATITGRSLSGTIAGDDVSLSGGTATFADATVGPSKPVSGSGFTLAGADQDDYSLASVDGTTAGITYAPATATCVGAAGHSILAPINTDGTSVFKQGSTVPAKFRVCDATGNSIGTAGVVTSFRLTQTTTGTATTSVNETVDSTTPGTDFRWSPTDQQWIFNMNTKSLAAGRTYVYTVTLNDGTSFQFKFGLK